MTRPELIRSFTDAALSPDPELASAALMIARVEYAEVDAARYLAELDFIGVEARRRLSLAAPSADTPPGVDAGIHAKVLALNELLFDRSASRGTKPTTRIRATAS